MSTINERIQAIVNEKFNGNVREFERASNLNADTLKHVIGGRHSKPSFDTMEQIVKTNADISPVWLLTGRGVMENTELHNLTPINDANTIAYKLVPLLNLDAVGGMRAANSEYGGIEYVEKYIPFTEARDGDIAMIVSGDSMSPTCPAGSKVLIREVPGWNDFFGYGNIFVILLTDGRRILKEVLKYDQDPRNYILCKSHNEKYPEEELPKSMIVKVFKVIKILNERGW